MACASGGENDPSDEMEGAVENVEECAGIWDWLGWLLGLAGRAKVVGSRSGLICSQRMSRPVSSEPTESPLTYPSTEKDNPAPESVLTYTIGRCRCRCRRQRPMRCMGCVS